MAQKYTNRQTVLNIKKNADLTALNTLHVPAKASKLIEIISADELKQLHEEGLFNAEDPFILGGGSNILIKSDINRTVLKISIGGIHIIREETGSIWVEAGAGVNWHELVTQMVNRDIGGIENLALIPGTVGAAPMQNIGAYGVEFSNVLESVTFFRISTGKMETLDAAECRFGYRDSIFKQELKGKVIITGVVLKLTKPPHTIIDSYKSLQGFLQERGITEPCVKDIYDAVIAIRRSKLPDPNLIGNAGSFFKNPVVKKSTFLELEKKYPDIPHFPVAADDIKIPAGWLIEKAGWKGKKVGNVGAYKNQALVIVNHGGATGLEILNHAMKIRASVAEKFGVELVPEVNIVE